jgi:hypothetical protein
MSDDTIARVHYFERQFLRTQDFTAEQQYHMAMRRRHYIAHHIWGIVAGLRIEVDKDNKLWIGPGMAIDGYGRELILPTQQSLRSETFDEKNSDTLGVWLIYDRVGSDQAPQGYGGCEPNGAGGLYRWQELARPRMDKIDPNYPDMRKPKGVPEGDWVFDPSRTPPDDPEHQWPVFVGQITRERPDPTQPSKHSYKVVQAEANRPYAGLVGEAIVAPSGRARLQLGAESRTDERRFALFLEDPADPETLKPKPALEIGRDGAIDVRGTATVHGDLTMDGGAIEFRVGTARTPQARPWQIYQAIERRPATSGADSTAATAEDVELHELRVEMAHSGKGLNKVVVGTWSADDKAFKPCLTIADDCQVTVHGNLIIQGILTETQARPAPRITPQTRALALSATLDTINRKIFAPSTSDIEAVTRILSAVEGRRQVVILLQSNNDLRNVFFADLLANAQVRSAVVTSLLNTNDGQQAVASGLLASSAALAAVMRELANSSVGRTAISDVLLTNAAARTTVITGLLNSDAGRSALSASLRGLPEALAAVLRELANSAEGRGAIGVVLQANEPARTAVLTSLLASSEGREGVANVLLANGDALNPVVRQLASNSDGQNAIVTALRESAPAREAILAGLLTSSDGRTAVASALLADATARQAVVGLLASDPDGQNTIIAALKESAPAREAVLVGLLESSEGRAAAARVLLANDDAFQSVVGLLAIDVQGSDKLIGILLRSDEGRRAVATALLNTDAGRDVVMTSLRADVGVLRDVMRGIVANTDARKAVADVLLRTSDQQALNDLATGMLDTPNGARAAAQSLDTSGDRLTEFVNILKAEFPALRAKLQTALT